MEEYLYKYMSFEKFIDLIENKRLYLTHLPLWDDVYEGLLLINLLNTLIIKVNKNAKIII